MVSKKAKCVRCESMERKQQSKSIYLVKNELGEMIPLCATCMTEIRDEEILNLDGDESGSEEID
jgi:hypothetical protein